MKKLTYLFVLIALLGLVTYGGAIFLANKGVSNAQVFLGNMYRSNFLGFIYDGNKAKNYLLMAAKNNDIEGQCSLGELYASQKDYQPAAYWYLQSALNGSHRCQINFEKFDFPDEKKVFEMLKKKATQNNPYAEYLVGKRYIEGIGVDKNIEQGINYLKNASNNDSEIAKIYLANLYIKGDVVKRDYDEANKLLDSIKK